MSEPRFKSKQFGYRICKGKRTEGKAKQGKTREEKRRERGKRKKILIRKTFHGVDEWIDGRQQRDGWSKSSLLNLTTVTLKTTSHYTEAAPSLSSFLSILSSRSITGLIISQIWFPKSNIPGK